MSTNTYSQNLLRPDWKYRTRLGVVPILAKAGRFVGLDWRRLGRFFGREVTIAQASELKPNSHQQCADQSLDIVFMTMTGGHVPVINIEITLALALRARGHKIRFVVCDQTLPACEIKRHDNEAVWDQSCAKCWSFGKRLLESYGFEIIPLSSLSTPDEQDDRWSEIINSALLKHFRVGFLPDTDQVRRQEEKLSQSARISASAGANIAAMRPDRVVMSHGIYATWGPALSVLDQAGIPVALYEKGKKRGTLWFNWNVNSAWPDLEAEWQRVKDSPLTAEQEERLDVYLASRRTHENDTVIYNFGDVQASEQTYRRFDLDPRKQTFVLFTNLLWDAASAHREIAFKDQVDWICQTINWFAEHPEKQLLIKIHPAEQVMGTQEPMFSVISSNVAKIPGNVRIIEPGEPVNSWSMLEIADFGLVHTTTVGLELALESVPCIVVSKTHYREKGFTIDIEDRDGYFDVLRNWDETKFDRDATRTMARRYANIFFERYHIPFDLFDEPEHTSILSFKYKSVDELCKNTGVEIFSKSLEQKTQFLLPS